VVISGIDPSVIPLMLRPEKRGCIIWDHWTVISADGCVSLCFWLQTGNFSTRWIQNCHGWITTFYVFVASRFFFLSYIMISRYIQRQVNFVWNLWSSPNTLTFIGYCIIFCFKHCIFQSWSNQQIGCLGPPEPPASRKLQQAWPFFTQMLPNASCLPALYTTLWYCVCECVTTMYGTNPKCLTTAKTRDHVLNLQS